MRFLILAIPLALLLSSCSTKFYNYQGGQPIIGKGGACENVKGVDVWIEGTPPRPFRVIGVITDERPGGPIPMAARQSAVISLAKSHGGDAIVAVRDDSIFLGTFSSGSSSTYGTANTFGQANTTFSPTGGGAYTNYSGQIYGNSSTFGSSSTTAITRRESRFYVLNYLK